MSPLTLLTLLALGQQPAVPKLACASFVCSPDIAPGLCEAYERRFTSELTRTKELQVTTERDVAQLMGLERQKQLMGCADDSTSCGAELAGALGVDGLMSGSVTRTPSGYLLAIKVLRLSDGTEWVSASERFDSEGQLLDKLDPIAARFVHELNGKKTTHGRRIGMLAGAGLGLALSVTGGVLIGLSKADAALLRSDQPQTPLELEGTASRGNTYQTAGALLLTLGVPTLATFLVLAIVDPGGSRAVTLVPSFSSDGVAVTLHWVWP